MMLQKLVKAFRKLPGVGEKTAYRYAHTILGMDKDGALEMAAAITELKLNVSTCEMCNNITDAGRLCRICSDPGRDTSKVMLLEDMSIQEAVERTGEYKGLYFILPHKISTLKNDDLQDLDPLINRALEGLVRELVIATNPTLDGDMIGMYLADRLAGRDVKVTRIAYGIPVGIDLVCVDDTTLARSLSGRREIV